MGGTCLAGVSGVFMRGERAGGTSGLRRRNPSSMRFSTRVMTWMSSGSPQYRCHSAPRTRASNRLAARPPSSPPSGPPGGGGARAAFSHTPNAFSCFSSHSLNRHQYAGLTMHAQKKDGRFFYPALMMSALRLRASAVFPQHTAWQRNTVQGQGARKALG